MADFTLEAGLKAKASDIQTFVREIQGQLNNKHRVSIPFAPDQKSMADFAKKLQDEINKQSVSVKVKVDYGDKGSSGGASGEKKKAEEAANSYAKLTNAIRDYYAQTAKMTKGAGSEEFSIIEKRVESARTEMDRLNVSVEDLAVHFADGSIKDYLKNVEGLNLSEKQLDTVTKAVADGLQKVAKANDEVASKTKEQANADKDAADAANNRAKEINKLTNSISSFIKSFIGIASVTQLVKSLYNNVVDLDKAVVDLQIATGYDRSTVSNMVKQYSKLGQQLGVTTVDVTKAADSWLRQGYEAEQATTLITASTMLAKLGQLDMSAATDYLTSTMKGYGIAVNDVVSIVDKLSAVDLVSATSSGDLAEAMQKTAVTANQTGIPLEKLIGMLATISEVSQQSASTVGTAMKSMLARMVNIKAGMLADPETGEDLSNVEAALRGVGIALRDTNGDFRNLDSVLEETAAKWQTLTGVQRNAIAVALGGTRQQENVRILMEYWDQVVNLTNVATNSAGTAQEKFEAYSNSVEAKINALKAAWQSLSDTILSSDFIKGVVDVLTVIVNALDALGGKVTVIAGILGIFANKIYKTGFNTALNGGATWLGSVHAGLSNISSVLGKIVNFLFVAHPVATAIVAAIGAIGYGIYKYNKYIDDAPARVKETNEEISKQKDRYTEVTDEIKKLQEEGKKDGFNDNIKSQIILLQQEKEELEEVIHKLEEANKAANQQAIENANRSYDNYARNTYYAYSGGIENTIATGAVSDLAKRIRKEEEYLELMSDPQWDIVFDIMSGATYGDFITGSAHMSLDDMSDGAKAALANFLGTDVDPDNIMMEINAFREYYEQYSGDMKVLERIYNDLLEFRQNDFLEDGRKAEIDSLLSDTIFDRFRENAESNADAVEAAKKRIKKAYSFRSNNSSVETKAEKEAAEAAKRIMDVRMAVYAEESRKQLADLLRGTYDKIDGKTFEDVATPYDDEWYARYFPDFAKQRDELIELYPELEKYFELWGKGLMSGSDLADKIDEVISAAERASNKDVFSAVENLFNADWSGDKEKAISELEKVALAFGVDSGTWGIFEEILKTSNLKTDKNSLLDMMINFLDGSTIEGAAELAKHLKDIKDAVAAPENKTETIWTQFENAVKAFDNASDLNEQTKAIADMIDALAKMPDVPEDVFDNVLGMILALKRHDLSLEDFKDAIYDIAQQYPVIKKFVNLDWDEAAPSASVKDAYSALKDVFDAEWSEDKNKAITSLEKLAAALGVGENDISAMSEMLKSANLATDKNSIIDMIVSFLESSGIENAKELIDKLLELRDAAPAKKTRNELFGEFSSAISGFNPNGSAFEKNQSVGSIASAARLFFGDQFFDDNNIQEWIDRLRLGEITLDDFKNKIWEISQGTFMSQFIPDSFKKDLPEVSEQMQGLASSLNSLMSQGSNYERNSVFGQIKANMEEIESLSPEVKDALEAAMQAYLEDSDEDAFKAAIVEAFSGDEAMQQYILDSWLPEAKTVKQSEAIKDVISDINSLAKEDTQQGRDEYYEKITGELALLGITAENTAKTGLFEFLKALQNGTLDGEEFENKLYEIAQALTTLLRAAGVDVDLTHFLPDREASGYTMTGYIQEHGSETSSIFARSSISGKIGSMAAGDQIGEDDMQKLLQIYPELERQARAYAEAVESGADASAELLALQKGVSELDSKAAGERLLEYVQEYADATTEIEKNNALEGISDALDGLEFDSLEELYDAMRNLDDGLELTKEQFDALNQAALLNIAANFNIDSSEAQEALNAIYTTGLEVTDMSEEMLNYLLATGKFKTEEKDIKGSFPAIVSMWPFRVEMREFDGKQKILVPTEDNPFGSKKHGGGGKKGNNKSGKSSILSQQYTNDKGLYDTLLDNLKNLNNLYEEGSDEWLANQQRIIETYQAYAKTIQDEYDRLTKAGVSMIDSEMQTLSKDLLKVNKELYDASKEYWEAVRDNQIETMEHIVSQMDAVLDLRDAHKDLLTELRQESRELEKQYRIAQDEAAHPGLTDAERDMLFSSEDYKRLTGMLRDISEQADKLYEDYRNKIASVTEDETYAVEYITDEYERQLGLLESQYEVAKQQLAVEKARQELQNTLRERNTAVLINGTWTWMADPDAVQSAMENVADAEIELEDAITDMDYQRETAEIETARDAIKSSIDAMEALEFAIEDLADGIVDLADAINENIFNAIGTTSRKYLEEARGNGLELFRDELTELHETSGLIFANSDVERLYSLLSSGNTLNASSIFDSSIVRDSAAVSSILSSNNSSIGSSNTTVYIGNIKLNDQDSEMLLNALDRVAYTWQA